MCCNIHITDDRVMKRTTTSKKIAMPLSSGLCSPRYKGGELSVFNGIFKAAGVFTRS